MDRTGKRGRLIGVERVANVFDRAIPRRVVADPVAAHTGGEKASGGCEEWRREEGCEEWRQEDAR